MIRHQLEKTVSFTARRLEWIPELEAVLRACGGLRELYLEMLRSVPANVVGYPSLRGLSLFQKSEYILVNPQ